ncbi:DUF1876 domain-containing protein [Mycobacterium branderi]|uniref:DUF1876 domain-containing protein n=1 Tax=Mycobacterium branderi TaxID=43348 RepID=A0A7I7W5A9_9MYCO|nr:DUF1876 domain-containing protein [Mycobacterium branderi]MCV7231125.1 DUF1876 domain-containing protein [Mycobacterium branderi]ORA35703.1 hypothetical protein BST20_16630 [Mycobacterium branderi]BBZ12744.1 hypothetical protein MBRA_29390 [Mycobacterium branderi]
MKEKESTSQTKHWAVEISIDEHRKRTRARARLHWRGRQLTGLGIARVNPSDRNIPEIGDELAVARALSNLADELFAAAAYDIHTATHEPVVLVH